jgi:hypothetical protein
MYQTDHHEHARIAAVRKKAVHKSRHTVKNAVQGEEQTKVSLGDSQALFHYRHGDAEIFANEIERGVADNRRHQNPVAPEAITGLDFVRSGYLCRSGRRRLEYPQHCREARALPLGGRWGGG